MRIERRTEMGTEMRTEMRTETRTDRRTGAHAVTRHGLRWLAFVGSVLACLIVAPRADAQQPAMSGDANAVLLRCSATIAHLLTPLAIPNGMPTQIWQPKDTAQMRIWSERTKAHTDSAITVGRACLATVNLAQVTDTLLDTLFDLQAKMHQDSALVTTVTRIAHASLPLDDRVSSLMSKTLWLPLGSGTLAMLRAQLPLVDSLHNVRMSADMRVQLMDRVRRTEPRAAYLEYQRLVDFLATLTPVQRDTVVYIASRALFDLASWGQSDTTVTAVIGLSTKIFSLYPNNTDLMRQFSTAAERVALVGAHAKPFTSTHWLYMSSGETRIPVDEGRVTLVEFTDLTCSACKLSYQPLQQWSNELRGKGLNILFVVPSGPDMTDYKKMYDHFNVTLPVMADNGSPNYHMWYHDDRGHPMFVLIDKHGIIRDMPLGWYNDGHLKQMVSQLLAEQ